ncbi:MAG: flagellar biosynthetic protein FliO [Deltaproteobacteria bacterium]|nr:flagellar biosynthetic protein FliO [Deltaproteobacteria bacterium]
MTIPDGPSPAMTSGYGELLVSSLVVLVVVSVIAWAIVRFGGRWLLGARGRTRGMDVVARLPLEPRRSLYVVEVGGKTLLVGTSEMGLSVLTELDGAKVRADVEEGRAQGGLAAAWRAIRRGRDGEPPAAAP